MEFTITIQASGDHRGPEDTLLSPAAVIGEDATAAAREVAEADPAISAARAAIDALVGAGMVVESAVFSSGHLRGGSFDLVRDLPDTPGPDAPAPDTSPVEGAPVETPPVDAPVDAQPAPSDPTPQA
jgi:hypothetical protein